MSEDMLTERRQWYHCFPEGTIEFNLVTRIVVVGMLGALAVLPESQHVLVINGLVETLWFDALLIIWWAVQIGMDLETSIAPSGRRLCSMSLNKAFLTVSRAQMAIFSITCAFSAVKVSSKLSSP